MFSLNMHPGIEFVLLRPYGWKLNSAHKAFSKKRFQGISEDALNNINGDVKK